MNGPTPEGLLRRSAMQWRAQGHMREADECLAAALEVADLRVVVDRLRSAMETIDGLDLAHVSDQMTLDRVLDRVLRGET